MKRMRFLVAILIIWLFIFYNIERLRTPINITGAAYAFVPMVAVLTIFSPPLRKVPLWVLVAVALWAFLMLKIVGRYRTWGANLPLTVTEMCALALTTVLARWVSEGVDEFENAVTRISIGHVGKSPEPFSTGRAEMYRELRRARHHQRPLALMAIGIQEDSIRVAIDRMVQEVQQAMIRQYVLSSVAGTLDNVLEDYNIVARSNDHFLVLLPEVTTEQLTDLVGGLRQSVSKQVGVTLEIGTASFPDDAMTFDSLVERATAGMRKKQKDRSTSKTSQLALESHTPEYYTGETEWS